MCYPQGNEVGFACSTYAHHSCQYVADFSRECYDKPRTANGTAFPSACLGCCTEAIPLPPPMPPAGPAPLSAALGLGLGITATSIVLIGVAAFAFFVRRWRSRNRDRQRSRFYELNDLGTSFTFGRDSQAIATPTQRGGRTSDYKPPPSISTPSRSGGGGGGGAGGATPGSIEPLNWGLSVSSPNASTC